MRALITGITGFAGSYLAEHLLEQPGVEVYGWKRWNSPTSNVDHVLERIRMFDVDIGDPYSVRQSLEQTRPDRIFHLAARSYVPMSFRAPHDAIRVNALGTLALLEAVRHSDLDPVIHVCSSSEVYGQVPEDELPITEDTPLRPQSPYGVSKVAEDLVAYQYHMSYGLRIVRSRAFTHVGARGRDLVAMPAFARQIAEIELGLRKDPVIRVGNLDSTRTFAHARDIASAYWLLTEHGKEGDVYNIAGQHTCTIREMLDALIALSDVRPRIEVDPELVRPSDVTRQVADVSKFQRATGWEPEVSFESTVAEVLDYWRGQVSRAADGRR
ncbi:GDP-mannose 4,6-dehydratase [Actinoplanes sp. NPDC026619]|uniref:GDP-mannose 4,6-dehydratase n=1 Tax=Actinoplanes sp. NPDC026619 TaxID=3155798 RepID=UPI003401793B